MCPIVPTFTCGLVRSNFSFAICCFAPQSLSLLKHPVDGRELGAQLHVHLLQTHQVKLPHLALIGDRQALPQTPGGFSRLGQSSVSALNETAGQHRLEVAHAYIFLLQLAQELLHLRSRKDAVNGLTQFRENRFVLYLYGGLLDPWSHICASL